MLRLSRPQAIVVLGLAALGLSALLLYLALAASSPSISPAAQAAGTPTPAVWALPTPFADLRGRPLAAGQIRWVLVDTVLKGNVLSPEIRAQGEFALSEVELENQGAEPVVFDREALSLVDPQGSRHLIQEELSEKLALQQGYESCLGQPIAPGERLRCRVLIDVVPVERASPALALQLSDLRPRTNDHVVVPLDFLGIEPQRPILPGEQ